MLTTPSSRAPSNTPEDDNLTYGSIISVYTGPDDTITAMTDDGIDELKDMLRDAWSCRVFVPLQVLV